MKILPKRKKNIRFEEPKLVGHRGNFTWHGI